ncbi:MAG: epsL, partial [Polaromonas sp.]|nr:epsL [Polaromonas sp.]
MTHPHHAERSSHGGPTGHCQTYGRPRSRAPVAVALMLAFGTAAQADELDTLQFRVGESLQRDSNVFRLSDQANTQAITGRSERADTIAITTLGAKFNKQYGLQRVELDADFEDYRYQRYSNLSFTAVNYAAAWRW